MLDIKIQTQLCLSLRSELTRFAILNFHTNCSFCLWLQLYGFNSKLKRISHTVDTTLSTSFEQLFGWLMVIDSCSAFANCKTYIRQQQSMPFKCKYRILPEISPLPSLTFTFLHRYVCLDYKPPSHQVDCTYTRTRARTYVTPPFN